MKNIFATALAALALLLTPSLARGQAIWTHVPPAQPTLSVEALRASLDGLDQDFFSGALFLSGSVPVGSGIRLVADVPLSRFAVESGFSDESQSATAIGNPYVGAELDFSAGSGFFAEFGARLPVASSDDGNGLFGGLLVDQTSRLFAFYPDAFAPQVLLNYRGTTDSPLRFRLRGGPQLAVFTGGGDPQADMFFKYSAQAWYDTDPVTIGAGLTGAGVFSGDGDLGDRTANSLTVTAVGTFEAVQPGLLLRAPISADQPELVVGLTLAVPLR